ncbi:MAG: hypothetical protein IH594_02340 [Bacteroidales bacterium]|nr:hypothetical protein [Bacteroidales bacterium]
MKKIGLVLFAMFAIVLSSCEKEEEYIYKDGAYQAEEAEYHYGWKAYLNLEIKKDKVVAVEFDYFNAENKLKSETTADEYPMPLSPSIWIPQYEEMVMEANIINFTEVDVVTGATGAQGNLNDLLDAILEAAKSGNTTKLIVAL